MIDSTILEDVKKIRNALRRDDFEGKRVLVAGGAGFVGSWICDVLAGVGAEVVCLDNFSTGKKETIDHLLNKPFFKLTEEDVCNFQAKAKFDYVLHLASRASPEEYQQHPIETLKANSLGSYNMLEVARKHDAKILYASTSEVYGDAQTIPTPENYWGNVNPTGARSCYDEGKRFGEALFMAYHRQHGLDVRIARIFNTYGPRLRSEGAYGRVVSRFITQALAGQSLTVYGDGMQTRSFCYITDTAAGLLLFLTNKKAQGEVVNIGNPEEMTILELAQMTKRLVDSTSPITFHPLPQDDPKRRCPTISKAFKLLRWKPKIRLEEGLERTMTWFKGNINREEIV
jgi:UDP-glucuronate decarboxylase